MVRENERERVVPCLRQAFEAARFDARHVFWRLVAGEETWLLECTEGSAMQRLLGAVRAGCPDVPLQGVLLPGEPLDQVRAWVRASVADVRRTPSHQAEQVTQVLQGELLDVLLHEDGWLLVRLGDGYLGWLRDWHVCLGSPEAAVGFGRRANARIAWPLVAFRETPDGTPCGEGLLGTVVVRRERGAGWCAIELPGERQGWVPEASLRDGTAPWPLSVSSILAMLHEFRGIPYVWGGKSPKGFDCSGLVQFVYALHGVLLQRDSDQQFQEGESVANSSPGDLLFFGSDRITHVGVSLGGDAFIHARGEVRCNGLSPGSPLYAADLAGIFRGARRVLPQTL